MESQNCVKSILKKDLGHSVDCVGSTRPAPTQRSPQSNINATKVLNASGYALALIAEFC
jgi:hypothetical protein